jgi:hypothetical protein
LQVPRSAPVRTGPDGNGSIATALQGHVDPQRGRSAPLELDTLWR